MIFSRSRHAAAAVLLLCFSILISGCQPGQDDSGNLLGTWQHGTGPYLQFNADGTFLVSGTDISLQEDVFDEGLFRLEGDQLTLATSEEAADCAGLTGSYALTFEGADSVSLQLVEDECNARGDQMSSAPMARVTP